MKGRMVLVIVRNVLRLLTYDFLRAAAKDPRVGWRCVKLTFVGALEDIVKMILIPDYPENKASKA